ncbi:glycosyltransferase [Brachyspira murdochii]|uniref:Glycosyl transferase family 8 n=1 Tax=Brachyspira murdochii TaxID=84378 RepID=A0ABX5B7W8_9SPIR|nr:glycosyltransferase [Brachyspira murdochii]PPS22884.1 glycosyl transferase family 8 [Brachyspira murdochii]
MDNKKKKIALLLCSTGNEAFAVGNVIIGAKKYLFQNLKDEDYDVVFYTDKLEPNDENALKKIFPRIIIRIYKPPFDNITKNTDMFTYYSLFTYARFEGFDMLDDYRQLFYIDTDVVIQKDISHVFDIKGDYNVCYYGNDIKIIDKLKNNANQKTIENIIKDGYSLDKKEIMAGIYILNDTLHCYKEMKKWLYDFVIKYKLNDEDTLSIAMEHFNIKVNELDKRYNCLPWSEIAKYAYILHSIGPKKFWRDTYNKDWEDNNKIWTEYGGNTTYNEIYKKRKIIDKIVWLIPSYNLRNKIRGFLLKKIGLSAR